MTRKIKRKGDSLIRDALILCGITAVIGLILGATFKMTKPSIDNSALEAKKESYLRSFKGYDVKPGEELAKEMIAKFGEAKDEYNTHVSDGTKMLNADGSEAGYSFIATSKGYNGDITVSVGINTEGVITGIDIVSMNETAGLGANCTDEEFKNQFIGKSEAIVINKKPGESDAGIDAISGATVTTSAVTRAVNQCFSVYSSLK